MSRLSVVQKYSQQLASLWAKQVQHTAHLHEYTSLTIQSLINDPASLVERVVGEGGWIAWQIWFKSEMKQLHQELYKIQKELIEKSEEICQQNLIELCQQLRDSFRTLQEPITFLQISQEIIQKNRSSPYESASKALRSIQSYFSHFCQDSGSKNEINKFQLDFSPLALHIFRRDCYIGGLDILIKFNLISKKITTISKDYTPTAFSQNNNCIYFACSKSQHFYKIEEDGIKRLTLRPAFEWCWNFKVSDNQSIIFADNKKGSIGRSYNGQRQILYRGSQKPWGQIQFENKIFFSDKSLGVLYELVDGFAVPRITRADVQNFSPCNLKIDNEGKLCIYDTKNGVWQCDFIGFDIDLVRVSELPWRNCSSIQGDEFFMVLGNTIQKWIEWKEDNRTKCNSIQIQFE